jgi:hypothetical protein
MSAEASLTVAGSSVFSWSSRAMTSPSIAFDDDTCEKKASGPCVSSTWTASAVATVALASTAACDADWKAPACRPCTSRLCARWAAATASSGRPVWFSSSWMVGSSPPKRPLASVKRARAASALAFSRS